jgi:bifunctional DNase/RNase
LSLSDILEMKVAVVTHDPTTNQPVLILKDDEGRILPIWIGPYEAYAIVVEMEGVESPRPMTHDLMANFISALDANVDRVIINELEGQTFYSQVILETKSATFPVDSRPSDAVALALRTGSPIYVVRKVLDAGGILESDIATDRSESEEKIRDLLENLKPSDFEERKGNE